MIPDDLVDILSRLVAYADDKYGDIDPDLMAIVDRAQWVLDHCETPTQGDHR